MKKLISTILALVAFLGLSLAAISPASASVSDTTAYCKSTASDSNPFLFKTAKIGSLIENDGTLKRGGINADDIVPPFDYDFGGNFHGHFAGQNWSASDTTFMTNQCTAKTHELGTPDVIFTPATCGLPSGSFGAVTLPEFVTASDPVLNGKTWTVTFSKPADTRYDTYVWASTAKPVQTFKVTDPITDPLWDSAKTICRMPDTGAGVSSTALLFGGTFVGLGLMAIAFSTIRNRRNS